MSKAEGESAPAIEKRDARIKDDRESVDRRDGYRVPKPAQCFHSFDLKIGASTQGVTQAVVSVLFIMSQGSGGDLLNIALGTANMYWPLFAIWGLD